MKTPTLLTWLALVIAVLALVAAGTGVFWQNSGKPFDFITLRGDTVQIHGQGLYRYDSSSAAAQLTGGDVVTLVVGIPLLLVSLVLYRRGSLRGHLLLTGTLGYFMYTYASLSFLAAYNNLFLVYVALFSLSLIALVLSIVSIDIQDLPNHFSAGLPRRAIAVFLFAVGLFLLMMWLGLIVPPLMQNSFPPKLESYTTLVIQALDLGIIMPAALIGGYLLLKRSPAGYLLASVVCIKGLTLGSAVTAMTLAQLFAGQSLSFGEIVMFPLLTLIGIGVTLALLRNLSNVRLVPA